MQSILICNTTNLCMDIDYKMKYICFSGENLAILAFAKKHDFKIMQKDKKSVTLFR